VERNQKAMNEAEAEAKRAEEALAAKLSDLDRQNNDLEKRVVRLEREELAPLEAEATARKKRFDELKASIADSSKRIGAIEKRLARATVAEPELRADAEADLAAARAEKQALARDEPMLAESITDLAPKVEAKRKERDELRAEIKRNKDEAARETERLEFQAEAARARKTDSERSKKAVAVSKDQELVTLGEIIDRERPRALQLRLRPADEHAAAIAILERRILELEDAARVVDRSALIRGAVWLALFTVAVAVGSWLLVYQGAP
jgi:chromosome segregation ATPase